MTTGTLVDAVLNYSRRLATLPESALAGDWPASSEPGSRWSGYEDTTREVVFRVYQELCELAVDIATRATPTTAQRVLAQHQLAYRDLTGALAGVHEDEIDVAPAEGEWPLRTVLYHVARTERGFFALLHWAVRRRSGGDQLPIRMPDEQFEVIGGPVHESGTLVEIMQRYDDLHARVLRDFAGLSDDDLAASNLWWEGYEVPARFRLQRLDAHLREHTIQVDKTMAGIGRVPGEPERLARLTHRALGEVEGAALGAPDAEPERRAVVARYIAAITSALLG
jgi:hypothetical protein